MLWKSMEVASSGAKNKQASLETVIGTALGASNETANRYSLKTASTHAQGMN